MSFANPLLLLALVGAAVPIIIHLIHKRRPREQQFAAIELLLRSVERVERRWRLRRILLLAARVLLLAALALAAAGPLLGEERQLAAATSGPQRLGIVVDASLSMRATYEGATAFSRAIKEARNLVDAMGPEDLAVIVAARATPALVVERPTGSKAELLRALDALKPSFEHADLGEAISTAAQALGSLTESAAAEPGTEAPPVAVRVVALTDLAQPAFGATADLSIPGTQKRAVLELSDVLEGIKPERRINTALTAVEAANVPGEAPRTVEVRARVQSFEREANTEEVQKEITLKSGEVDLFAGNVGVVPGTIVDKVLHHSFDRAGVIPIAVQLEQDTLREDDVRYEMADVRRQVRALIVDGAPSGVPKEDEIFYLERALQAGAADQPPARVVTADDLPRADLSVFDVVIMAGVPAFSRSQGARLVDFVKNGGGLLITASEDLDVELFNSELGQILPRPLRGMKIVDPNAGVGSAGIVGLRLPSEVHPVMELFQGDALSGLASTRTRGYLLLQPGGQRPLEVLAEYDDGQPALVVSSSGQGRLALLTTSIDRELSDLAIRPAFVPLMRRLLLYLGHALSAPDPRRTIVAEPRDVEVPAGARELRITGPDGRETSWSGSQLAAGRVRFGDTELPGHYLAEVSYTGAMEPLPEESFAVNADTRESDLRPLSKEEALAILEGTAGGTDNGEASALLRARALTGALSPEQLTGLLLILMVLAFLVESALTAQRIGR